MISIRRILVPFSGHACEIPALRLALTLARGQGAHVEVWHVSPDPAAAAADGAAFMGMYYAPPDRQVRDLKRCYARKRRLARAAFHKALRILGVAPWQDGMPQDRASASFHAAVGDAAQIMAARAEDNDLTIMCRQDRKPAVPLPVITALLETGRPLLLLPPAHQGARLNGRAVIAWNGSDAAAHAVNAAMPLLEQAQAWVVTAGAGTANRERFAPDDLVAYLRRHHIDAQQADIPAAAHGVLGDRLLQFAWEFDAGLIVMGAFGHSPMREALLGGPTDFMLRHANVPVLLAH